MKINVVALKQVVAEPQYEPRRLDMFSRKDTLLILSAGYRIALNQMQALSAFLTSDRRPVVLFFLRGQKRPFLVDIARIDFEAFHIPRQNKASFRFRHLIRGFCKNCPGLTIDKSTYFYLKGQSKIDVIQDIGARASALAQKVQAIDQQESETPGADDTVPPNTLPLNPGDKDTLPATPLPLEILAGNQRDPRAPLSEEDLERTEPVIRTDRHSVPEKTEPEVVVRTATEAARAEATEAEPVAEEGAPPVSSDRFPASDRFISMDCLYRRSMEQMSEHLLPLMGLALVCGLVLFGLLAVVHLYLFSVSFAAMFATALFLLPGAYSFFFLAGYSWLSQAHSGASPSLVKVLQATLPALVPTFLQRLAAFTASLVGLCLLILPGAFFANRMMFIEAAVLDKPGDSGSFDGYHVSSSLVRGFGLSVFSAVSSIQRSTYLVLGILFYLITFYWLGREGRGDLIVLVVAFAILIIAGALAAVANLCVLFNLYNELKALEGRQIPLPGKWGRLLMSVAGLLGLMLIPIGVALSFMSPF